MKSIFDGWTKQILYKLWDGADGFCARGWIFGYYGKPHWAYSQHDERIRETEARLAKWIEANLPVPERYRGFPGAVIAWANNSEALGIEGFRMADLLSQGYTPEDLPEETPEKITEPDEPTVEIGDPAPDLEPVA